MNQRISHLASERGSGTVVTTALVIMALLLAGVLLAWVAAVHAAMDAAAAADLAALAGADTARGLRQGDPCGVARSLAQANNAMLESCIVEADGQTVAVSAKVPVSFHALGIELYAARAKARAGAPPLDQTE
ncbi:Rv3654c family TadE-like protein [Glutamicibacter sp. TV12E]|uniref:Rv3654c family TadE-like protein n=1 Tax=Glutamicibacter sp. TV12E TaxID=3446362 RepID=UPI0040332A4B